MNIRKRALFHLAAMVLFAAALPGQQAIGVGTWNIEFLGANPKFRRGTPARTDEDLAKIGAFVRELDVSLLAVQEICGEPVLRRVAEAVGPTWRAVLGTTGQWTDGQTQQGVGILYDAAALDLLHCEELLDFPSEKDGLAIFHRKPVTACLRHRQTGADFRVVVVHLKAGRKDRDRQKRRAEATTLRAWIDELTAQDGEDPDIVILGDFNSTYGTEPERILERGGDMQYLDQQRPTPTIVHFDEPIVQICVARGFAEVDRESLRVHGVADPDERRAYRKTYSDHFPVTFRVQATHDDDPDATFSKGPPAQVLPTTRRRTPTAEPSTTGGSTWPPEIGAQVHVFVDNTLHRGRLAKRLPMTDEGWVVIQNDAGTVGFPTRNVTWVRVVR